MSFFKTAVIIIDICLFGTLLSAAIIDHDQLGKLASRWQKPSNSATVVDSSPCNALYAFTILNCAVILVDLVLFTIRACRHESYDQHKVRTTIWAIVFLGLWIANQCFFFLSFPCAESLRMTFWANLAFIVYGYLFVLVVAVTLIIMCIKSA